jgi:cation diffusion facilitator CzcD-associated flavoprotein CzcO
MSIPKKTIVVVGAGSAGLAALKALLDVSKDSQECWEIALYEKRSGIGGIW